MWNNIQSSIGSVMCDPNCWRRYQIGKWSGLIVIWRFWQFINILSHLLHLLVGINSTFSHLLTLVVALHILLLVLINTLHILNHLVIAWRDHISILILHQVFVLWTHALRFFAFSTCCSLLLFEQGHIKLCNRKKFSQRLDTKGNVTNKTSKGRLNL